MKIISMTTVSKDVNGWHEAVQKNTEAGAELEHFSTAYSPAQGIIYSGVFVIREK